MAKEWMREIGRMLRRNPDLQIADPRIEEEMRRADFSSQKGTQRVPALSPLADAALQESEHQLQARLFALCAEHPECPALAYLYAIPNGGHRHPIIGAMLKAEGVKAGILDLFLPVARGGYFGMYIEMKRPGGIISEAQRAWIEIFIRQGYLVEVHYAAESALDSLLAYLRLSPTLPAP